MTDVSILGSLIVDDPQDYSELEASCGKFVETWLAVRGEHHREYLQDRHQELGVRLALG